jgi:GNAT superfamily N-acetyltransferase
MWVLPDWIGRGAGRALLCHAIEHLRADGARTLRIESDPYAEGFYVHMGARRVGEAPSTPEGRTLPVLLLDL